MDAQNPYRQTIMVLAEALRLVDEIPLDALQRDAMAQTITALLVDQWQQWQEDQQADAESKRAWALLEKSEEDKRREKRQRTGRRQY